LDLRSENNGLHNLKVIVKLLSISQLFLLCVRASTSTRCVASLVDAFSLSRSVSQHPKFFQRIVGLRLGLRNFFYRRAALLAIETFASRRCDWLRRFECGTLRKDYGSLAMHPIVMPEIQLEKWPAR